MDRELVSVDEENEIKANRKNCQENAATGFSTAGFRTLTSRVVAFYFRAPVKAFVRARVDYLAYARAIHPHVQRNEPWSLKVSTPAVLAYAVTMHGWSFIPKHVLPPLLANMSSGAVLYTTYLQSLELLDQPTSQVQMPEHSSVSFATIFAAGSLAGSVQALVAAPVDALQVRFRMHDMLQGRYKDMWHYAHSELKSIGMRGVFAGFGLSLVKDLFGFGLFFATFEYVKSQGYQAFLRQWYGSTATIKMGSQPSPSSLSSSSAVKAHFGIEPTFLLLAGISAAVAQQIVFHPLSKVQALHHAVLEQADHSQGLNQYRKDLIGQVSQRIESARATLRPYFRVYYYTFTQCRVMASKPNTNGLLRWLYNGFVMSTVRQIPSTSAGLIVFELLRRRYSIANHNVTTD